MPSRPRAATSPWAIASTTARCRASGIEPDGEVGAMGGLATTAPDYARYVAFLLAAWPARDDPETGPVRRVERARDGACSTRRRSCPTPSTAGAGASAYGYGLINAADAQARPPPASFRRPAGLRLARADAARARHRRLRLRQPHLRADVAHHAAPRRAVHAAAAAARAGRAVALAEARGRGRRGGLCRRPHRGRRGGASR